MFVVCLALLCMKFWRVIVSFGDLYFCVNNSRFVISGRSQFTCRKLCFNGKRIVIYLAHAISLIARGRI